MGLENKITVYNIKRTIINWQKK